MSRRSTLGPLSLGSASLNSGPAPSRKSLSAVSIHKSNAAQPASQPQTQQPAERLSLSRNSLAPSSRRSSAANKAGGPRADPRPIGDKSFLRENIKRLIMYLAAHNYQRQISPKLLMAPSGKDFRQIVEFLFQQFDPSFEFSSKVPFEEEVKKYMKAFGYPMPVSKQSLSAPGIPHTWPALLAMLVWLIEFLQYYEKLNAGAGAAFTGTGLASKFIENENNEKLFFDYTAAAYANFLAGSDSSDDLDSELRKSFDVRNAAVQNEMQSIRKEKKRLQTELEALKKISEEFESDKSKKVDLSDEVTKFHRVIDELKKHKEGLEQKIEERKTIQTDQKAALQSANEEKEKLSAQVAAQEFTPLQVQSMANQRVMLEESAQSLAKQKEKIQNDLMNANMTLSKKSSDIRSAVERLNDSTAQLAMELNQMEIQHQIQMQNIEEANEETHTGNNIMQNGQQNAIRLVPEASVILKALNAAEAALQERATAASRDLRDSQEEAAALGEAKQERTEKISALENRLKKIDETYKSEREVMQRELTAAVCRVEDEELEIHKLKASSTMELENSNQQIELLEEELRIQSTQHDNEKRAFNDSLMAALETLVNHKERVQERLNQISSQANQTKLAVANL